MIRDIIGLVIKSLMDDQAITARVSDRIYPDESNVTPDSAYPMITVTARMTGKLRGTNAALADVNVKCFSSVRDDADAMQEAVMLVLDNTRMSMVINGQAVSGSLQIFSSLSATSEPILEKWYAESDWEGRFVGS